MSDTITEEHIKAATAVYDDLAVGVRFAVISGSHAFGLGHGTSDVDFYIMTADGTPLEGRFCVRDGLPVQVNPVTADELEAALAWGADDSEFTSANRAMLEVPDDVCKLAIRLGQGHVVYADPEGHALLSRFDPAVMRRRLVVREARECGVLLEDVAGALAVGDHNTAFLSARMAVSHGCEAAMAACGDIYVGRKFLLRRLNRIPALAAIRPQITAALDIPGWEPPLSSLVDDRFSSVLRERALLGGYLAATASLGWDESPKFPPMALGTLGPIRDPYFTLLRFHDGIGLAGPDKSYRVSADAARLWLSLDGRRRPDLFGEPDSPAARGVAQLITIGAAHPAAGQVPIRTADRHETGDNRHHVD
jgi:hypothetical protein